MAKTRGRVIKMIVAVLLYAIFYEIGIRYPSLYYYTVMFLCPICLLYIIFQILLILNQIKFVKRIWEKVELWGKPALERLKHIWSNASNALLQLAHKNVVYQKFEYLHLRDRSRITGYSDEYRKSADDDKLREYGGNRLKWKKCKTNQERIRFLYSRFVIRGRRQGKIFTYSDTPNQLREAWGEDLYHTLLTEAYYQARYDEEAQIEDEVVRELAP